MSDDQEPQAPADDAPDAGDGAEMSIGAQFRAMAEERAQHAASGENDPESVEIAGVRYKRPPGSGMTISELRAAFEKMNPAHTQRPPLAHSIAQVMSTLAGTQDAAKAVHTFTASMLPEINTAQSMLSALHWDWAERMKELNVGMGIAVGEKFRAADAFRGLMDFAELWAARNRRARDMARPHVTDAHVRESVGKIDWEQFLAAQREGDTPDTPTDDVLEALAAQLARPADTALREELTRELLYIGWAHAAGSLGYDGPNTEPFTYDDPETGETQTFTATAELVTDYLFTQELSTPEDWAALSREYVERDILAGILESLERGAPALVDVPQPNGYSALDTEGRYWAPSAPAVREIHRALMIGAEGMRAGDDGQPTVRLRKRAGVDASIAVLHDTVPAAWEAAKKLGPAAADAFIILIAHYVQNRQRPMLWEQYDGYIGRDEVSQLRGKRMHKRVYRPEDCRETVEGVTALSRVYVNGIHTIWQKGKAQRVPIRGQLFILDIIPRTSTPEALEAFLAGAAGWGADIPPENVAGWGYRIGPWGESLRTESPQLAPLLAAVLQYPAVHGLYPRRLGFVISMSYRDRAHTRSWDQPYRIRDLLDDAGIPRDRPERVLQRFAEAWETLERDGITAGATYDDGSAITPDPPTHLGRYWFKAWLDWGVCVTPPSRIERELWPIGQKNPALNPEAKRRSRKRTKNTRPATA